MRRVRWSSAAAYDLEQISNYLHLHHPSFANHTIQGLYDKAKSLREFPYAGRQGRKVGTRELVLVPLPYVMVYDVNEHTVNILRIIHTSRDWK